MGIFTQFYMRAGVFTDGGKREREAAGRKGERVGAAGSPRTRKLAAASDHDEPL